MSPRYIHQPVSAICSWCKASKPHYSNAGKLVRICIDCRAANAKTPEYRARMKVAYRDNLPRMILDHARRRARDKGLVFDLVEGDIIVPKTCPIFGTPLEVGSGKRTDSSPTLDRIDLRFGYVVGNVWVISWRANRIKNDSTLEELRQIVSALEGLKRAREVV